MSFPARSVWTSEPAFTQYSFAESMFITFGQVFDLLQRTRRPSVLPESGSVRVEYENGKGASGYRWFCRLRSVRPDCSKR